MLGFTVLPLLIDSWFELPVNVPALAPVLLVADSNGLTGEKVSWGDFPNANVEVFPVPSESEPEPEPEPDTPPCLAAKLAAAFGVSALISCPGEGYNLLNGALIVLE